MSELYIDVHSMVCIKTRDDDCPSVNVAPCRGYMFGQSDMPVTVYIQLREGASSVLLGPEEAQSLRDLLSRYLRQQGYR